MNTPMYFTHGKIIAESGDIKVYEYNGVLYLEQGPGHGLWADSDEIKELSEQIGNKPKGDCLEIGLGLGVASKYILSNPNVKSLTTIELSPDVVKVYGMLNKEDPRHTIIYNVTGLDYIFQTDKPYDFIFLDFYSIIDEDAIWEIEKCVTAGREILNNGGEIMAWFDPYTPDEFAKQFFAIFD
jgi:hypothetical protein